MLKLEFEWILNEYLVVAGLPGIFSKQVQYDVVSTSSPAITETEEPLQAQLPPDTAGRWFGV